MLLVSSSGIPVSRDADLAAQQQSHPVTSPRMSVKGGYGGKAPLKDSLHCASLLVLAVSQSLISFLCLGFIFWIIMYCSVDFRAINKLQFFTGLV